MSTHLALRREATPYREEPTLASTLLALDSARNHAIATKMDETTRDEYLRQIANLSVPLREASGNGKLADQAETVMRQCNENPALLMFDPLQEAHWRKKNPSFLQALGDVTAGTLRGQWTKSSQRHHILQALKYILATGNEFSEKEAAYNTILPLGTPLMPKAGLMMKALGFALGSTYDIELIPPATAKITSATNVSLDELLDELRSRGFISATLDIEYREGTGLAKQYPNTTYMDNACVFRLTEQEIGSSAVEALQQLYALKIPDIARQNLVLSDANFAQFGNQFMAHVAAAAKPPADLVTHVDRRNQSVVYAHTCRIGEYERNAAVQFRSESSALIITISRKPVKDIIQIASEFKTNQSLPSLAQSLDTTYLRVAEQNPQYARDEEVQL